MVIHFWGGVFFLNIPVDNVGNRPQMIALMELDKPNIRRVTGAFTFPEVSIGNNKFLNMILPPQYAAVLITLG